MGNGVSTGLTKSYNFTGVNNTLYYWRVVASNGASTAASQTWAFLLSMRPWWQVAGSGVTAVGNINSVIPTNGGQFIMDPPGIPVAGGGQATFNNQPISSKNWIVADPNSDISPTVIARNGYDDLERNILGSLTPAPASSPITSVAQLTAGTAVNGVYYVKVRGNLNLASSGPLDLGTNRIVLLVDGDVAISNTVNLTDNRGYLLLASSANMTVDPAVDPGI